MIATYQRIVEEFSDDERFEREFGFLTVMSPPLGCKWEPSLVQIDETLGHMKDWLERNKTAI